MNAKDIQFVGIDMGRNPNELIQITQMNWENGILVSVNIFNPLKDTRYTIDTKKYPDRINFLPINK